MTDTADSGTRSTSAPVVEHQAADVGRDRPEPMLFISHRHADRAIADVLREFVTSTSGADVIVFQSSSPDAGRPIEIGKNINRELVKALWRSQVLLLIYTGKERDWDYCMFECGVATHSQSEDTRVAVVQCGSELPKVFDDTLAVVARDPESVRNFVNQFLTDPDFFPGRHEAVTRFQSNDANVRKAAQNLFAELDRVLPNDDDGQVDEWPALPFLRLEIDSAQVAEIASEDDETRARHVAIRALLGAAIVTADRTGAGLFGKPNVRQGDTLSDVLPRAVRDGSPPEWFQDLGSQVARAAHWNFPSANWGLMRSAEENDQCWYSPVLTHVRRFPSHAMQFDVYFPRFVPRFASGGRSPGIRLPFPEGARAGIEDRAPSSAPRA